MSVQAVGFAGHSPMVIDLRSFNVRVFRNHHMGYMLPGRTDVTVQAERMVTACCLAVLMRHAKGMRADGFAVGHDVACCMKHKDPESSIVARGKMTLDCQRMQLARATIPTAHLQTTYVSPTPRTCLMLQHVKSLCRA